MTTQEKEDTRPVTHGEGLDFETRVMDGHAFELNNNSFDMVGSRFGVQNHKSEVTHGNIA